MTSQELMTLAADRIPVKIAILDNKKLGMIRQWQEIIYAGNYHSAHLPGPDFVKLAEAYGIPAFKATTHRRGRPDDPGRAGGRRAGPHLVRDRRGAERVPDDAGGQGPVRPDRDLGGARGMSADDRRRAPTATRRAAGPRQRAAAAGPARHRRRRSATSSWCWSWTGRASSTAWRSLMRARNFNIDSLAVSRTDRESVSRMTITIHGDDVAVEQATKQLYRLVDVLKVQDVERRPARRARAGVREGPGHRREPGRGHQDRRAVQGPGRRHRAGVGDRRGDRDRGEIDALVALLRGYGIKELVRTGAVVMLRGAGSIEEALKLDDSADVLRRRRGSARPRRADGRDHRLRQPGPRPRPEPARQRRRRRRRARPGLEEPRRSPRPPASGSRTSPTRSRPPT